MRVMQVMAGGPVGGIETFFYDGVLALADAGLTQFAVVRPNMPIHLARLKAAEVPVATADFNSWWRWPTARVMRRTAAEFRPDIVQYWTGRAASYAVAKDAIQVGWYGGYRQRKHYRTCTEFLGVTRDMLRHIESQGVAEEHTTLVHNFTERRKAAPLARKTFSTPDAVPLLLALARLHWMKGLDTLLDAAAKLPGVYLWIAGEGPDREKLVAQAAQLGIADRVRFLGWREDKDALLAAADICVVPSRYESFGAVLIEAWAADKPLVAAAAQGPRAYVEDEKNGMLVPMNDAEALARAIGRVIADKELRTRIVEGGRKSYEARFTKEVYVRDMLAFYERILKDRPRTNR
jgi:glycosyltransferase involved in cell wall biosynthesis